MGVGKVPLGEVTVHMLQPPADPQQLDKLTISTDQASRWMLPGGAAGLSPSPALPGPPCHLAACYHAAAGPSK